MDDAVDDADPVVVGGDQLTLFDLPDDDWVPEWLADCCVG